MTLLKSPAENPLQYMKVKGSKITVIVKDVARAALRPNQNPARITGRKNRLW
jgi:ribosomal protein L25 (general stress protein Ctc)